MDIRDYKLLISVCNSLVCGSFVALGTKVYFPGQTHCAAPFWPSHSTPVEAAETTSKFIFNVKSNEVEKIPFLFQKYCE